MPPSPRAFGASATARASARAVVRCERGSPSARAAQSSGSIAAQTAFSDSSTFASARHSASIRGVIAARICGLFSWLGSTLPARRSRRATICHLLGRDQLVAVDEGVAFQHRSARRREELRHGGDVLLVRHVRDELGRRVPSARPRSKTTIAGLADDRSLAARAGRQRRDAPVEAGLRHHRGARDLVDRHRRVAGEEVALLARRHDRAVLEHHVVQLLHRRDRLGLVEAAFAVRPRRRRHRRGSAASARA